MKATDSKLCLSIKYTVQNITDIDVCFKFAEMAFYYAFAAA